MSREVATVILGLLSGTEIAYQRFMMSLTMQSARSMAVCSRTIAYTHPWFFIEIYNDNQQVSTTKFLVFTAHFS